MILLLGETLPNDAITTVLAACARAEEDWMPFVLEPPAATLRDHIKKARHDINNPLGAALVEVQLLLMDVSDPEVLGSLATIEDQLRRIKELVAALGKL